MKLKRKIATALAAVSALGSLSACSLPFGDEGTAPDYSGYDNQFLFYCYMPPNDGTWYANDGTPMFAGEDYRNTARYKEYKDCGFDLLMMQHSGKFNGTQEWEESITKMVMDQAWAAGIDKMIVTDIRLQELSEGIVYFGEDGKPHPDGKASSLNYSDANRNGVKMEIDLISERLVCEDGPFKTEAELDEYVAYCMAPYMNYHGFYGVQLKDEPNFKHVTFYGDTYRSVKRVCPTAFVQYNLNQAYTDPSYFWGYPDWEGSTRLYLDKNFEGWRDDSIDVSDETIVAEMKAKALEEDPSANVETMIFSEYEKEVYICEKLHKQITAAWATHKKEIVEDGFERYGNYLRAYIDETGADYMLWDSYPLQGTGVRSEYIRSLQVTAEVCKEKGVTFANTTQAQCEEVPGTGQVKIRALDEDAARWLNNMLLGFGVKQIVYYTYFNKGWSNDSYYPDGTSFITHYGEKTDTYYFMQKILAENQKFAPTILNFDYVTSNTYTVSPSTYSSSHLQYCAKGEEFKEVVDFEINKESALVTELYDDENEQYAYMVQNVVDPKYQGAKAYQTATLTFKDGYTHALVWKNGESTTQKLSKGKLVIKQHAGEAVYVLPY